MRRFAAALALPLLFLCGCSEPGTLPAHPREVEELQLIQTLGYDRSGGLTAVSAASGRGSERMPSQQLRGTGTSISAAIENMQELSPRETLFFAHTRFLLLGEAAAREGIEPLMDWVERSAQTRLTLPVFLVEGGTAEELIYGAGEETEISQVLASLQREAERLGWAWGYTLRDMARDMAERGCALCCSLRTEEVAGEERLAALSTGFALFRGGRLLCCTGEDAARGVCLLLNKAGRGTFTLPTPEGGEVTLELTGGGTDTAVTWREDGTPELTLTLRFQAGVVEAAAAELDLPALNDAFSAWLARRAGEALSLLRETGADFLDLGGVVACSDPKRFAALDWEETLRALECVIDAQGVVERSYDITAPGALKGGGGHGG